MPDLFAEATRRDPFPLYDQMRCAAPVLHDPRTGLWMLFGYDAVKRALTDVQAFSSAVSPHGTNTARWLIFTDPPRHGPLRALVAKAFTPRTVAALAPRVRSLSAMLLDRVAPAGRMELVADYAVPLPMMVIAELLGLPTEDWPRYRAWSDAILALAGGLAGGAAAERAASIYHRAHGEMAEYLAPLVAGRRVVATDDLLGRLVAAEVEGTRLTDDELLAFFELLLLAGHETTTNLLGNAVLTLLEHPRQLALLRREPARWPAAIEEVLRFRSPVQAVFRVAREPVTLEGETIPAGALVLAMLGSANHDEAHFREPDVFDVTRAPNPHLAFGHGIHFCVGAPLARLEASIALPDLFARFPTLALVSEAPWTPREAFHVHGPARLELCW
ncbi:MAG TPA: cytochrome P450 [Gemmatimonadaceae bacterium]|nr:cytochrome P450 [Gemmatimonadaceae bacterium]